MLNGRVFVVRPRHKMHQNRRTSGVVKFASKNEGFFGSKTIGQISLVLLDSQQQKAAHPFGSIRFAVKGFG